MIYFNGSFYYDDSGNPVAQDVAASQGYMDLLQGSGGAYVQPTTTGTSLQDITQQLLAGQKVSDADFKRWYESPEGYNRPWAGESQDSIIGGLTTQNTQAVANDTGALEEQLVMSALLAGGGALVGSGAGLLSGAEAGGSTSLSGLTQLADAGTTAIPGAVYDAAGPTLAELEAAGGIPELGLAEQTLSSAATGGTSLMDTLKGLAPAASLAGTGVTLAGLAGGGDSQSGYYLDPANDPFATPEGQAASTAANSAAGSGMDAQGFPLAGYNLSPEGTGLMKSIADALGTTPENLTKLLGAIAPAALGAFGANQQANSLADLARQQMELEQGRFTTLLGREDEAIKRQQAAIDWARAQGQPYRDQFAGLLKDPSSFLTSPGVTASVDQGTNSLARALSAKVGNPIENPTALGEMQGYATNTLYGKLGEELNRLMAAGGLTSAGGSGATVPGIGTNLSQNVQDLSGKTQAAAIGADSNIWNAIGSGIANVFNPQPSLADLLKQMQGSGIFTVKGA